jgi:hypothetical protein
MKESKRKKYMYRKTENKLLCSQTSQISKYLMKNRKLIKQKL